MGGLIHACLLRRQANRILLYITHAVDVDFVAVEVVVTSAVLVTLKVTRFDTTTPNADQEDNDHDVHLEGVKCLFCFPLFVGFFILSDVITTTDKLKRKNGKYSKGYAAHVDSS
jgi:hypothetical protein